MATQDSDLSKLALFCFASPVTRCAGAMKLRDATIGLGPEGRSSKCQPSPEGLGIVRR